TRQVYSPACTDAWIAHPNTAELQGSSMLHVTAPRRGPLCNGPSRRDFVKIGALGLSAFALPNLLKARAAERALGHPSKNPSVVWLWLGGGPTHVETFDPKMSAPVEYRSTVGAVKTCLLGVEIGGVFPKMAAAADQLAFVRSFAHTNSGHGGGTHWVMTGYDFPPADNGAPQNRPGIGSLRSRYPGPDKPGTGQPTLHPVQRLLGQ